MRFNLGKTKFKKFREESGLTQAEFARILKVSKNSIANWEYGGIPNQENIAKICETFSCKESDIV